MSENQEYWFAKVDIDVIHDKTLSQNAKWVFTVLCSFADKDTRGCWPSNKVVAETADVSVRSVQNAYKELEERGIISRESRFNHNGQTSSYSLIVGHNAPCYGKGEPCCMGGMHPDSHRTRINEQDIKDSLTREAELPTLKESQKDSNTEFYTESFSQEDAPEIMRPTAEYLLLKTGRKTLTENEISALRELSANHYPARVQKEIDRACERFERNGNDLGTLTFCYIAGALRNQPSRKNKSRKKSESDGMSMTQAEIAQTQQTYTEEDMKRVEAMMRERG